VKQTKASELVLKNDERKINGSGAFSFLKLVVNAVEPLDGKKVLWLLVLVEDNNNLSMKICEQNSVNIHIEVFATTTQNSTSDAKVVIIYLETHFFLVLQNNTFLRLLRNFLIIRKKKTNCSYVSPL
jgi:hypothetical protein